MTLSQPPVKPASDSAPTKKGAVKKAVANKAPAKKAAGAATPIATPPKAGAKPAAAPSVPALPATKVKHKLVRDSFTIPKPEYAVLEGLKLRAANLKRPIKKGELLRAGIAALQAMSDSAFLKTLASVPSLKTGRPKNPAQGATALAD